VQGGRAGQVGEETRTTLRVPSASAASVGTGAVPVGVPPSSQNFAEARRWAPQLAQGRGEGSRAFLENFAPERFSC
jgi:hypothetical protein